jgi:hypothetical protein
LPWPLDPGAGDPETIDTLELASSEDRTKPSTECARLGSSAEEEKEEEVTAEDISGREGADPKEEARTALSVISGSWSAVTSAGEKK